MDHRPLVCIALMAFASAAPASEGIPPPVTPVAAAAPIEPPSSPRPETRDDIRIVIDTSGSMRQTDPKNLRVPALKLLVNLLPAGSRAGVWLFDTAPRELVAVAPVDTAWQERAGAAAAKIDSRGAFTHIEDALSIATADWTGPADGEAEHRHLILLTDGRVDVSRNHAESAASRERILKNTVPALQQAGAKIHTIALSEQSDKALMRQLALTTGGWSAVTGNADQLQRTFIGIFDKAAPHDSLPIRDNRFTVDTSVQEFTVLVLLKPAASPTALIAPGGRRLTQSHLPDQARWLHEAGYDLITVPRPAAGEWGLEAAADPANQVFVVADLKMEPAHIPSYLWSEENPEIAATFTENGQIITREDFLGLLSVRAELQGAAGKRGFVLSRLAGRPGTFRAEASPPLLPGEYTLAIFADGKTFQRETRQTFRVMADLLQIQTLPDPSGPNIVLTPNPAILAPESLAVQATLTDQSNQSRELTPERTDSAWRFKLPAPAADDRWVGRWCINPPKLRCYAAHPAQRES